MVRKGRFWGFLAGLLLVVVPVVMQSDRVLSQADSPVGQPVHPKPWAAVTAVHLAGQTGLLELQDPRSPVEDSTPEAAKTRKPAPVTKKPPSSSTTTSSDTSFKDFDSEVSATEKLSGLFTVYQKSNSNKLLAEIQPEQLNQNFLCTITLESGLGAGGIYSGLPIGDMLFYFQRVNNNLQFVVRNVNFRVQPGDPVQDSVRRSFSDSVLYTLPIVSIHPNRKSLLVDLSPMLLSDFANLNGVLDYLLGGSYSLDTEGSYLGRVKTFPLNVELESIYNFIGSGGFLESLADSRAFTLRIRYSLSQLPDRNNYRPRLADNRVGYFITAYKDLSSNYRRQDAFVRYINRWQLEKKDPQAELSPPQQPIVFWIENTVPKQYRDTIRDGVLMWNRAFEKIGFKDALVVKQMPNNATWDPADIRYNTIRWFHSNDALFALGPSRVNPLTGQILDADILIAADMVRYVQDQYKVFGELGRPPAKNDLSSLLESPAFCNQMMLPLGRSLFGSIANQTRPQRHPPHLLRNLKAYDLCYGNQAVQHLANAAIALNFRNVLPNSPEMDKFVKQFLQELVAHEIGHTLGLRHNFHGSTLRTPDQLNNQDLNNQDLIETSGLVSSVMDYNPPNIAPSLLQQGSYFTPVIGPYDEWAIAYGYTPLPEAMIPLQEQSALEKIASRASEPDLAYGTDEDAFVGLDPDISAFDLSGNSLVYAQQQMERAQEIWNRLDRRYVSVGDRYSEAREIFDTVFFNYLSQTSFLTTYIGGQHINRAPSGNPGDRFPFEQVAIAEQKQALDLLQQYVFSPDAFQFSPTLLNRLAPSRWLHWGSDAFSFRLDYPVHQRVLILQTLVMSDLLSSDRLERLVDAELKTQPGEALQPADLFTTLQNSIWAEVLQPAKGTLEIGTLRRALQRQHLTLLSNMVLRNNLQALDNAQTVPDLIAAFSTAGAPEESRTLAWYHLRKLRSLLDQAVKRPIDDLATRAHLEQSRDRITKILDASLQSQ